MTPQLIITILSFILIWLVFKLIYLDKNPFQMTRFWLTQIVVTFIWFRVGRDVEILIPYILSFLIILIVFKIINREMNPFKRIIFWITQFMAAALITVVGFIIIFRAYGRGKSSEDNLVNSIELETIKEIIIIQYKDTVHVEMDEHFFELLEQVKVSGPLKFNNKGKIIITRMDGSKDSLNTNGYGYGPYKGKWYQSKENVLDEYFKK